MHKHQGTDNEHQENGADNRAKIWFKPVLMDFSLLLRKTASSAVIGSL